MQEKQQLPLGGSKVIHYVIVVHGIGQQRKNKTVLPVIKQFAAARHNNSEQADYLTLGRLTSQSIEQQWIEYQDIPNIPDESLHQEIWIPKRASGQSGKNIRFLDFCWSEITKDQHIKTGEKTKDWSDSLINRLKLRVKLEEMPKPTQWIVDIMQVLQQGMLFAEKIMNFRLPSISKQIFGDFLGDVEMYGDSPYTRGLAVGMFHKAMESVHQAHCQEFGDKVVPHYTIIAHSLGTIMTMDAIAFAHANTQSRASTPDMQIAKDLVFLPGYLLAASDNSTAESEQELPSVEWVKYLYSYVTLGSPIDKYLALWTENYAHFANVDWMDKQLIAERKSKIRHFNYADEQDPVGHELNVVKTTPVWNEIMEAGEDVVFTRYTWPGIAHIDYWKDYDLFYRILDVSIDNRQQQLAKDEKPQGHYVEWFDLGIYRKALSISYVAIPIVGWIIAWITLNIVVQAFLFPKESNGFPLMTLMIFVFTLYLTHILMDLIVKWRLVMVVARSEKSPMEQKDKRIKARKRIRALILYSPFLWALLLLASYIPAIGLILPAFLLPTIQIGLLLACVVGFDVRRAYNGSRDKWKNLKNDIQGIRFADYLKPLQKKH